MATAHRIFMARDEDVERAVQAIVELVNNAIQDSSRSELGNGYRVCSTDRWLRQSVLTGIYHAGHDAIMFREDEYHE